MGHSRSNRSSLSVGSPGKPISPTYAAAGAGPRPGGALAGAAAMGVAGAAATAAGSTLEADNLYAVPRCWPRASAEFTTMGSNTPSAMTLPTIAEEDLRLHVRGKRNCVGLQQMGSQH